MADRLLDLLGGHAFVHYERQVFLDSREAGDGLHLGFVAHGSHERRQLQLGHRHPLLRQVKGPPHGRMDLAQNAHGLALDQQPSRARSEQRMQHRLEARIGEQAQVIQQRLDDALQIEKVHRFRHPVEPGAGIARAGQADGDVLRLGRQ